MNDKIQGTPLSIGAMLRLRYQYPEWLVVTEATFESRRCDAMAVNLWPSAAFYTHGFEIKATRSDWLRELADVTKSEPIRKHCHKFWLVAPKEVATVDELPVGWGWLQIQGSRLKAVKQAKETSREALSPRFVARLMAKACEQSPVIDGLRDRLERAQKQNDEIVQAAVEQRMKHHKADLERHREAAEKLWTFQRQTGIYLDGSGLGARELKAIKALIVAGDAQRARQETERAITEISRVLHGLNAAKGALEAFEPVLERIGGRSED